MMETFMNRFFDFSNIQNSEETAKETWKVFRNALASNKFVYDDIKSALKETYLKVFDDLLSFRNNREYFSKELLLLKSNVLKRGAMISPDDDITYDRFIPNKKYIHDDNRFSPPGIEWLYLAIGDDILSAEECCMKECRVKKGDTFALCTFNIEPYAENKIVIDLTVGTEQTYDNLNHNLEEAVQRVLNKAVINHTSKGFPVQESIKEFENEFTSWLLQTYSKMTSEQLFIPVDTDDKSYIYSPFQCLAKYFISKGFEGIIYSSTIYSRGKNIVLFDKTYARPTGLIKRMTI